jgi:hypothetical protein
MILVTLNDKPIAAYNNEEFDFNETFLRQRWSELTLEPAGNFSRQLSVMTIGKPGKILQAINMRQVFQPGQPIVAVKMGAGFGYQVVTQDEAWRLPANLASHHLTVK